MPRFPRAELLWEDDRFLALDKPEGLPVIAGEGSRERTLLDAATAIVKRRNPRGRAAVVHRIDKGTSGVVLFAKDAFAKKAAMGSWDDMVVERRYALVIEGRLRAVSGRFEDFLVAGESGRGQTRVRVSRSGDRRALKAVTDWEVVLDGDRRQLVEAILLTGRKHQVRVQFAAAGHPVAGDALYGARGDPLGRLCLHACAIEFHHPFTRELVRVESPPPPSFRRLVESGR